MAPTLVKLGVAAAALVPAAAQTTQSPTATWYADQSISCTPGQSCPSGVGILVPKVRGLCVAAAGGTACWDACNPNHAPMDYSNAPATEDAIALMVKQIRTGMRVGSCGDAFSAPTCNPGDRCTPANKKTGGALTLNRGMCVTCTSAAQIGCPIGAGNECLDMCDTSIPIETFHNTAGKQAGTVHIVEKVRAGQDPQGFTTCPGMSVWVWLWIPITLCCLLGFCGLAYWMFNYYRGSLKRTVKGKKFESDQPFMRDDAPYGDYEQGPPQAYQDMGAEQQPMPVLEAEPPVLDQTVPPVEEVPALASLEPIVTTATPNLFGDPNLMAGLAPTTAMPAATYTAVSYPQAGSMALSNPMMGSTMGYAPYGAYTTGAPMTTSYPAMLAGSSSMRMG